VSYFPKSDSNIFPNYKFTSDRQYGDFLEDDEGTFEYCGLMSTNQFGVAHTRIVSIMLCRNDL